MKYDVFISYSRKDMAIADRICRAFDEVGIKYFIDRQGIGGAFEFPDVLANAIIDSKTFLLLGSNNSYNSKFTMSEVTFAFNEKEKNCVLPYLIDDTLLPPGLRFVFSSINWRNIKEHPIETVLVDDILRMVGRTRPALKVSAPRPAPKPVPPAKTYKVGDLYEDNGKKGVVFEVSVDGKHGKIVSLDESGEGLQWASNDSWREKIGADSETDGAANMSVVKSIPQWRKKYPAFAWCADLGEDWYLPANDELKSICDNKDIINTQLKIVDKISDDTYWSSTVAYQEIRLDGIKDQFGAYYIIMCDDDILKDIIHKGDFGILPATYKFNVRAVSAF